MAIIYTTAVKNARMDAVTSAAGATAVLEIGIGPDAGGETQPATGGGVAYGASARRFPDAAFSDM